MLIEVGFAREVNCPGPLEIFERQLHFEDLRSGGIKG
jgi:hypothetical protein